LFNDGKFDGILAEWRNYASFLGSQVRVLSGEEILEGTALDVDEDGALMIRLMDQTVRIIRVGDLTTLRQPR
jgi:BirA family biotin operon repressor/biotin-[acetyl-CoA-carboxylase] ligase